MLDLVGNPEDQFSHDTAHDDFELTFKAEMVSLCLTKDRFSHEQAI